MKKARTGGIFPVLGIGWGEYDLRSEAFFMEQFQQEPDLSQLVREQPGPEVFQRVWARVMPDQRDSPLAVSVSPRQEGTAPAQPAVPAQPAAPGPAPEPCPCPPPLCLGEASLGDVAALTALMDRARENLSAGQALSRRSGGRQLSELAADHRRALRQLSAARFLITGKRYRPEGKPLSLPADFPLALRDQFVREQRWERDCNQAAEAAGDRCLKELYLELAQDGALHAGEIRSLLERM